MNAEDVWIRNYFGDFVCPICDCEFDVEKGRELSYRHCPYCGERLLPPKEEDE